MVYMGNLHTKLNAKDAQKEVSFLDEPIAKDPLYLRWGFGISVDNRMPGKGCDAYVSQRAEVEENIFPFLCYVMEKISD